MKSDLSMVELGIEMKMHIPLPFPFLGQYLSYGTDIVYAFWNYSDNISDEEIAGSLDQVWGIGFHLGPGFVIGKLQKVNITIDIHPGVILWLSDSYQGFSNSVLPVYLKFCISLNCSVLEYSSRRYYLITKDS